MNQPFTIRFFAYGDYSNFLLYWLYMLLRKMIPGIHFPDLRAITLQCRIPYSEFPLSVNPHSVSY